MSDEYPELHRAEEAGEKSERLLDDTYLSGAVGMGAAGPRLSASALSSHDDEGIQVREDRSWRSHAMEEDGSGEAPAGAGGLRGLLRRVFGR
jgi:hypothetical protein